MQTANPLGRQSTLVVAMVTGLVVLTKMNEYDVNVDVTVWWLPLAFRTRELATRASFNGMVLSFDDRISGCSMARRLWRRTSGDMTWLVNLEMNFDDEMNPVMEPLSFLESEGSGGKGGVVMGGYGR